MSPERWERVKQIFDEALDLEASARAGFLASACLSDEELRAQVERLLSDNEQASASFLRTPAAIEEPAPGPEPLPGTDPSLGPEPSPEPSRLGATLNGRYRVERELGRGGSGVVYLARDEQLLDRPVVVKFLHERAEQHPVLRARFRHEMEALARIRHPGVVSVLDVGELPGGRRYLVMEYVEGVALRSQIEADGLDFQRVARLVRLICAALSAAHEKGIFHRDLKPENIMLLRAGEIGEAVKLIDFGIAKVEQSQLKTRTETWTFVGTINYASPEQLLGKAGAAGDIWALGVIAYEMVTGRRPFQPETPFHLYEMQRSKRIPDPGRLRPDLPPAARDVILQALSFRAADRHDSPAAFAGVFGAALEGTAGAQPLARAWAPFLALVRRRPRKVAAIVLAALVSALMGWRWAERTGTVAQLPQKAGPGIAALDLTINTPLGVAVDRRGNVYITEYANNRAWRVDPAGKATVLAGTGIAGFTGNGGPAASAQIESPRAMALDGEKYLYMVETTKDRVRRIDLATGVITHVLGTSRPLFNGDGNVGTSTSFSEGLGIAVDPRGDLIFADTNNHRLRRLSASDGRVSTIAGTGTVGSSGDGGPALAAQLSRPSGLALHPNGDLYVFEMNTKSIRRIQGGRITTIAGSATSTAMEGPALQVRLGASTGMALDAAGANLYFTEESFDTLRKLDLASMQISRIAGTGTSGFSGDGGPGPLAMMANPTGVAVDLQGNIFVAEAMSNRIRRINSAGIISTFAGGKVLYGRQSGPLVFGAEKPAGVFQRARAEVNP